MEIFNFDKKPGVDEHAVSPGSEASQSGSGNVSTAVRDEARTAAVEQLDLTRRRKRRRTGQVEQPGAVSEQDLRERVNAAIAEQLNAINSPEAWQALLTLPAHAAFAITGHDRWNLHEKEEKTLGLTGSAFGKTLMITNPRALAFAMLGSALCVIYGPRGIAQLKELREKKPEAEKK